MQSKMIYLLLAFAVTIAVVTATYEDDDDDDFFTEIENYMEKRGKSKKMKLKGKKCHA